MAKTQITMRWEFWATLGLSAFCGMLIVGGLLFGWGTKDVGFMEYCAGAGPEVSYLYTGDGPNDVNVSGCRDSRTVGMGGRRPLRVMVNGDADFEKSVSSAMDAFNQQVGCALFALDGDLSGHDVVISKGAVEVGMENHPGGSTSHWQSNGQWTADVVIYNLVLTQELRRGLMHELGHVVGLAHDSFRDSLMYRSTSGSSRLTDSDRSALRKGYCGGH